MSSSKRVLFRVDAGSHIGLGHLLRCNTLANLLIKNQFEVLFVCRKHQNFDYRKYIQHTIIFLEESGVVASVGELPHKQWLGVDEETDFNEMKSKVSGQFDFVVVDHYSLSEIWERRAKEISSKVLVIDDVGDRKHDCDYLLDQNYSSNIDKYKNIVNTDVTFLLGSKYALISPRFLKSRILRDEKSNTVLVNLGGATSKKALDKIIETLKDSTLNYQFDFLINDEELVNSYKQKITDKRFAFERFEADMAKRLRGIHFAIGAAGSSFWERSIIGVPSVLLKVAENQEAVICALRNIHPDLVINSIEELSKLNESIEYLKDDNRILNVRDNIMKFSDGIGTGIILLEVFKTNCFKIISDHGKENILEYEGNKIGKFECHESDDMKYIKDVKSLNSCNIESIKEILLEIYKSQNEKVIIK